MIGFKVSKHSGQQYLTFKPRKSFYFLNVFDMALETAIDPVVNAAADAIGKNMAALNETIKTTSGSGVWSNYTPTKIFLIHPQTLKDL